MRKTLMISLIIVGLACGIARPQDSSEADSRRKQALADEIPKDDLGIEVTVIVIPFEQPAEQPLIPLLPLLEVGKSGAGTPASKQLKPRPEFRSFRVRKIYRGVPARPAIGEDWESFQTRIREGAKSPVQFAGHYTVPAWGCGAGCTAFVILDSRTGTTYGGFGVADLPESWTEVHGLRDRLEFHPDSRLMKINGCINEQNCGFYDYVMIEEKGLKLVRKELLPAQ